MYLFIDATFIDQCGSNIFHYAMKLDPTDVLLDQKKYINKIDLLKYLFERTRYHYISIIYIIIRKKFLRNKKAM